MRSVFENWIYSIIIAGAPIFASRYNAYAIIASLLFSFFLLLLLNFEIRSFLIMGIFCLLISLFFKAPVISDLGYFYLLLGVIGIKVEQKINKKTKISNENTVKLRKIKIKKKNSEIKSRSNVKKYNILNYLSWTFFIISLPFMFDVWYYAFFSGELKIFFVFMAFGFFALAFLLRTLQD